MCNGEGGISIDRAIQTGRPGTDRAQEELQQSDKCHYSPNLNNPLMEKSGSFPGVMKLLATVKRDEYRERRMKILGFLSIHNYLK